MRLEVKTARQATAMPLGALKNTMQLAQPSGCQTSLQGYKVQAPTAHSWACRRLHARCPGGRLERVLRGNLG